METTTNKRKCSNNNAGKLLITGWKVILRGFFVKFGGYILFHTRGILCDVTQ